MSLKSLGQFPALRPRRLRQSAALRRMVAETRLSIEQLVWPLFARSGRKLRRPVDAMPGVFQLSPDELVKDAATAHQLGVPAVLLFGIPDRKDARASGAYARNGIVQQTVRLLKKELPELLVITDVCLCEYTAHGHCGVIEGGEVRNDATLELLARMAVSHAAAGAQVVAPSDMMDGRIGAVRRALDQAGFDQVAVLSYAAKYASAFYGPFREAADSAPQFGDRRGYQMDPPNVREALREVRLDLDEGADIVMVKPALAYLDVIRAVRAQSDRPVAAYNVSGEYAMVKAAAQRGWIDERRIVGEILTGIHRAGADIILTYHALDWAQWQR